MFIRYLLLIFCFFSISACVSHDGIGEYRVATIGNAQRTVEAIILSKKDIVLIKPTSGAGANAGAALGGAIAADSSDDAAVIVAGIIGGAIIGNNIEASAGSTEGYEYLIETETGKLMTVVQPKNIQEVLREGDKALLIYGYPHKLVKDPR